MGVVVVMDECFQGLPPMPQAAVIMRINLDTFSHRLGPK